MLFFWLGERGGSVVWKSNFKLFISPLSLSLPLPLLPDALRQYQAIAFLLVGSNRFVNRLQKVLCVPQYRNKYLVIHLRANT
jgi:hypothetical protein